MTAEALFDEPTHVAPPSRDYPAPELVHGEHEVPVWGLVDLGEEPTQVMAAGHGTDSRDALYHYLTAEWEHPDAAAEVLAYGSDVARWVVFVDRCGCAADEHAAHVAEQQHAPRYRTCDEVSGRGDCRSLAPCAPEVAAWITHPADASTPHAVPVSVVDVR